MLPNCQCCMNQIQYQIIKNMQITCATHDSSSAPPKTERWHRVWLGHLQDWSISDDVIGRKIKKAKKQKKKTQKPSLLYL